MPKQPQIFDAGAFFAEQGWQVRGPGQKPGTVAVDTGDGIPQDFDTTKFLAEQGIKGAQVEYNTPSTAVNRSPVGLVDRFKLSIGTEKGRENFLRKQFEDVAYDPESGLAVKNKGVWQQVDPKGMGIGSNSEKAWELAKDLADWAKPAAQAAATGAAATAGAAAGPAGAIGAAAATGGATEAAFTSLGRMVGTYDASIEEQVKDVAFETALSGGGQALAAGARPTFRWLRENLRGLNKASDGSKEVLSQFFSATTGANPGAFKVAMENPDDVSNIFSTMAKSGMAADDISTRLTKPAADAFLDNASKELPRQFKELMGKAVKSAKPGTSINMKEMVGAFRTNIEQMGLGTFDEAGKLVALTDDQVARRVASGLETPSIPPELFGHLRNMSAPLAAFQKTGSVPAPRAIELMANLNKSVNQVADQFAANAQDAVNRRYASEIRRGLKSAMGQELDRVGAGGAWRSAMEVYQRHGDAVNQARTILNSDRGTLAFAEQLLADSRAGRYSSGLAKDLLDLTGESGRPFYNKIVTAEAARQLSPWIPRFSGAGKVVGTSVGVGLATGNVDPAVGGVALAASSPRAAFNVLRYGLRTKAFMSSLPTPARSTLLKNPVALQAVLQTWQTASEAEQREAEQLLQQSGVGQ